MKTSRRPTTSVVFSVAVLSLVAGCSHTPKPPRQKLPSAAVVERVKAQCPSVFAIAEIPANQSCATFAAQLGQGLRPVPTGLVQNLRLQRKSAASFDPMSWLSSAGGDKFDRRIGRKNYCVLASPDRKALSAAVAKARAAAVVDCPVLGSSSALSDVLTPLMQATRRQTRGAEATAAATAAPPEAWTTQFGGMKSG